MAEPVSEPVSSLLHFYRLRASQTRRLPARSDLHKNAHIMPNSSAVPKRPAGCA